VFRNDVRPIGDIFASEILARAPAMVWDNERACQNSGRKILCLASPAIRSTSSLLLRRKLAAARNSSLIATIVSQRAQFMRRLSPPTRRLGFIARSPQTPPLLPPPRRYRYHRLSARIGGWFLPSSPRVRGRRRTCRFRGGISPPSPSFIYAANPN